MNERQEFYFEKTKKIIGQKGGKCLSDIYIDSTSKLKVKCSKGHIWFVDYRHLNLGTWCKVCANLAQKLTNEEKIKQFNFVSQIAEDKKGKCLSSFKIYKNLSSKLEFQCDIGHKWTTKASHVKDGCWCPVCNKDRQRKNINDIIKLVKSKGGILLTKEYKNNNQKLKVKCSKNHIWDINYGALQTGNWCPICEIDRRRNKIEDIVKFIEGKGGELLTKEYKNCKQKLKIKCSKGHIWKTNYNTLKYGCWCPICSVNSRRLNRKEKLFFLNKIRKIAKNKGGKCLSLVSDYQNNRSKLEFQCASGHIWKTTGMAVKIYNKWCPICCQSLSEKIFRAILETIFNCEFHSCRPTWLRNKYGKKLEIDGYNKELKLGFEHQGEQHFKFSSFFHKTQENFERRKLNDKTKYNILQSRNIFMLYPTYKLKKEDYFDYIKSQIINTPYEKLANFDQTVDINNIYKII